MKKMIREAGPKKISMPGTSLPEDPSKRVRSTGSRIVGKLVEREVSDFEKELNIRQEYIASSIGMTEEKMEKSIRARLGQRIKSYMNDTELHRMFWLSITAIEFEHIRYQMASGLTKEEHSHLKRAMTELWKFITKYVQRMDKKSSEKLLKKIDSAAIRVLTNRELQVLGVIQENETDMLYVNTDALMDLSTEVMTFKCKNCSQSLNSCDFFDLLDDLHIPSSDWDLPNCPYAFRMTDISIANSIATIREAKKQRQQIIADQIAKHGDTPQIREFSQLVNREIKDLNVAMSVLFERSENIVASREVAFKDIEWTEEERAFLGLDTECNDVEECEDQSA